MVGCLINEKTLLKMHGLYPMDWIAPSKSKIIDSEIDK